MAIAMTFMAVDARGFALSPLIMKQTSGTITVTNSSDQFIRVALRVYLPLLTSDNKKQVSSTPLPAEQASKLIRLRPSAFRLPAKSTKAISYKVLDKANAPEFFVCAETSQEFFNYRICSRWPG